VEWSVTLGCLAAFALAYFLFSRLFPIISIWEVQEGENAHVPAAEESAASESTV